MKFPQFEMDAKRFYAIGKYAFFMTGFIGLIRIVDLWTVLKSYDIFSSIANTIFNFTICMFFAYLQGKEDVKEVNDGDIIKMNEALNNLNLDKNKDAKKRRN